jgi:hypothetical protein
VDDLAVGTSVVSVYDTIIDRIGSQVELVKQGVLTRFNDVDIQQTREYIAVSCTTYIHGWAKPAIGEDSSAPIEPLPPPTWWRKCRTLLVLLREVLNTVPSRKISVSATATSLVSLFGSTLSVRLISVSAIGFMTRFSSAPAAIHYRACIRLGRYLRMTKDWKLVFWRDKPIDSLPPGDVPLYVDPQPGLVAAFPSVPDPYTLTAFTDAAHATDLQRRRSVSGFCCMFAGAAVAFKSKLQTIVATSSTEAEFICAVQTGETVKYLRTVLHELGFTPSGPTVIYEDNQAAIAMVNSSKPTPRSRHIDTQPYDIQGWKAATSFALSISPARCPRLMHLPNHWHAFYTIATRVE